MTAETPRPKRRHTVQKQLILETLTALGSHVSAGAVYQALQETHPEIGRATVFRVLADMAEDGYLLRIPVADSDDRYDVTTFPHDHIRCRICGRVDDVWFEKPPSLIGQIRDASGYTVEKEHIEFVGLCRACREKNL